ncbi:hypothetical protein JHL08_07415 [Vibrio campbellii]|jgi:hypothetical protein|uniref:hypothetical protein n=1 Tax=Vibrio campbellii TaxID=680 RepID=UPI001F1CE874|nr:hypothetical protein [Vibrio campbellii]MCE7733074.1 hypothetical protein [Vibrio campbellii]
MSAINSVSLFFAIYFGISIIVFRLPFDMSGAYFDFIVYRFLPVCTACYLACVIFGKVNGKSVWAVMAHRLRHKAGFNRWQVLIFSGLFAYPIIAILLLPFFRVLLITTILTGQGYCHVGKLSNAAEGRRVMFGLSDITIEAPQSNRTFWYPTKKLMRDSIDIGSMVEACGKQGWLGFYIEKVSLCGK